jgi:hypothetical protein
MVQKIKSVITLNQLNKLEQKRYKISSKQNEHGGRATRSRNCVPVKEKAFSTNEIAGNVLVHPLNKDLNG